MGYFSQLSIAKDFFGNRPDNSFPSRVMELSWRIEDLRNRLEETREKGYLGGYNRIIKEYLPYVLPEHLFRGSDIELAIELAQTQIIYEESENKIYEEEYPEERLSLSRVVIISAASTVVKSESRKEEGVGCGNPTQNAITMSRISTTK